MHKPAIARLKSSKVDWVGAMNTDIVGTWERIGWSLLACLGHPDHSLWSFWVALKKDVS